MALRCRAFVTVMQAADVPGLPETFHPLQREASETNPLLEWLQGNTGVIVSKAAAGCRDAQRPRNEEEGTHRTEP